MKKIVIYAGFLMLLFAYSAMANESFTNKDLGVFINIPSDWEYVSRHETQRQIKTTVMNDEEFKKLLLKYSKSPLLSVIKSGYKKSDFVPSIKLHAVPIGLSENIDLIWYLKKVSNRVQSVLPGYKVLKQPEECNLAKYSGAKIVISYNHKSTTQVEHVAIIEIWVTNRKGHILQVSTAFKANEEAAIRPELSKILSTLVLNDL